jgi:hypothetical protein
VLLKASGGVRAAGASLTRILREPRPARYVVLAVAALAAGGLGLMVAYAATSGRAASSYDLFVTNGETFTIMTVTGPSGPETVAVRRTKEGKLKLVPVRVLRTVTEEGGTREVEVAVEGPAYTVSVTETESLAEVITEAVTETQIATQVETQVETQIETEIINHVETQVVTEVVTQPVTIVDTVVVTDTIVVTDTVVVTETVVVPTSP